MTLGIDTSSASWDAYDGLQSATNSLNSSMQKLSSGLSINNAGDDAADLGISMQMQAQISGMNEAQQNTQQGISMIQTTSGALGETSSILQQINDLAVQYNNGTNSPADQTAITDQVAQLSAQLDQIQGQSSFNGVPSFVAGGGPGTTIQTGANSGDTTTVPAVDLGASLGGSIAAFATMAPGGVAPIAGIQTAISSVASDQANIGAVQDGLTDNLDSLSVSQENTMAANSSIDDVDFAQETTNLAQSQIMQQTSIAMLAQANQNRASVLALLN